METYIPDARSSAIFRKFVERETSESSARIAFWRSLPDLPTRAPDGHKGSFGTTLIVGGSRGMSGAVALAGITSLVCGSGLTRVVAPSAIQDVVAGYHAEYTTIGAACDESGRLSESALETILDAARSATVVAVGPGLGRSPELDRLVERLYLDLPQCAIFDADALNALASTRFFDATLSRASQPYRARVLTPHPGEFARLFEVKPSAELDDRIARAVTASREICLSRHTFCYDAERDERAVLLLKGRRTVVARSYARVVEGAQSGASKKIALESEYAVNETGTANLATGGSGDALTGVIAGLIAQGHDVWRGTILGAALHGLSSELRALLVPRGGLASDVARFLPCAMAVYDAIKRRVGASGAARTVETESSEFVDVLERS